MSPRPKNISKGHRPTSATTAGNTDQRPLAAMYHCGRNTVKNVIQPLTSYVLSNKAECEII